MVGWRYRLIRPELYHNAESGPVWDTGGGGYFPYGIDRGHNGCPWLAILRVLRHDRDTFPLFSPRGEQEKGRAVE